MDGGEYGPGAPEPGPAVPPAQRLQRPRVWER